MLFRPVAIRRGVFSHRAVSSLASPDRVHILLLQPETSQVYQIETVGDGQGIPREAQPTRRQVDRYCDAAFGPELARLGEARIMGVAAPALSGRPARAFI